MSPSLKPGALTKNLEMSRAHTKKPPAQLVEDVNRLRDNPDHEGDLSNAYREVLRTFRETVASAGQPAEAWRALTREAMTYLGGQTERSRHSMRDYDHRRFGPFLAVSNEGGGAAIVREAAKLTPKAQFLGPQPSPLRLGVAVDGERLGGVGEVAIGPDEYAQIWFEAVDRLLMTTNVGSRANLRFYKRPTIVSATMSELTSADAQLRADLAAAFRPFLEAPGGARPLTVFIDPGSDRVPDKSIALLQALQSFVGSGGVAQPDVHKVGLYARIGPGAAGRDQALCAIDTAARAGVNQLALDGAVRAEADAAVSLPGLLSYLAPDLLAPVLKEAQTRKVVVEPANQVDADTVARHIWCGLNTARAMGFDLGKYSLFPLTFEEAQSVIGQIQAWFSDWSAAPVFYADQGILTAKQLFAGPDVRRGIELWLEMVASAGVRLVLIDTVDKSKGWKLVKAGGDPKGLLTKEDIKALEATARQLSVRVMWAGGLEPQDMHELGRLGVFGVYVTTAVCDPAPVTGETYRRDPALASVKQPDVDKIVQVKTLLEAGFLSSDLVSLPQDQSTRIREAGSDVKKVGPLLTPAWKAWLGVA